MFLVQLENRSFLKSVTMAAVPSDDDLQKTYIYHQLDEYPWDTDEEFQGGLRAILGAVSDPVRIEHLTLRAKCYYYARKAGVSVDFDGYKQWRENIRAPALSNGVNKSSEPGNIRPGTSHGHDTSGIIGASAEPGLGDAPRPATFAEICDMIAEGKPIPGIKDIPDTILDGQATASHATKRKKPWETSETAPGGDSLSWMK